MMKRLFGMLVAFCVVAAVSVRAEEAKKEEAPAAPAAGKSVLGDATKGKVVFDQYCALCHGATGKGDGIGAAALNPKPRDFTDKALMSAMTDEHIIKVITEGGPAVGKSPFMTAWKALLKEDQIKDVAAYVRTFVK